jgi:hypothetical protein
MSFEQEILVPCKYSNDYDISHVGKVYSYKNSKSGYVLKPSKDNNGYLYISIYSDGVCVHHYIHKLIAEHFIPNNDPQKDKVNHKDLNIKNNHVSNLEWVTHKENVRHAVEMGAINNPGREVLKYDLNTDALIETFPSAVLAGKSLGITRCTMASYCRGKNDHIYKGFKWVYKDVREKVPCPENARQIRDTCYYITPTGKVWSAHSQKIKVNQPDVRGYERIQLGKKDFYIHKLVAEVFIGPCPQGYQVNHKDSNPSNNNVENLEYKTPSENTQYSVSHGNRPSLPIIVVDPVTNMIVGKFTSAREASECLDTNISNIWGPILGNSNTFGGYQWLYDDGRKPKDIRQMVKKLEQLAPDGTSVKIHDTITSATKAVDEPRSRLKYARDHKTLCKGYYWREITVLDIPIQSKPKTITLPPFEPQPFPC